MTVCAKDLLLQAKSLETSSAEIELRTCVNRAYYAAFHAANDWHDGLATGGLQGSGAFGVHQRLINCLTTPTVTGPAAMQSRAIGYMLRVVKSLRTPADYDLDATVTAVDAANAVAQTESLMKKAV